MKDLLKNAREQKGLKTREVAQMLHIDQALISKFENGQRKPTRDQLTKLATLLEIDFDTLLISWLKEKIIYEIGQDEFALKAIQLAEEEIKRNAFKKTYPISAALQLLLNEIDNLKEKVTRFRSFETEAIKQTIALDYIFNSNQLDGNTFSLEETIAVIQKGETIAGKSMREHLEAINHIEALRYLETLYSKSGFISEKEIFTLHNLSVRGITPEESGKYRTTDTVQNETSYNLPRFNTIPKLMADTFLWYETNKIKLHPVILAGEILAQLQQIQPFAFGNNKVARMIMNFILLQQGYLSANIKGDMASRMRLEHALNEAQTSQSKELLLLQIAEAEKKSLERYLNLLVYQ
ncbi:Fic family protein [Flavobacterium cerinum]|uniref:Fic family protein n=1 Tax=Flavobacterium cerinum TaxID=2502784 RepID=A0ABY5IR84_9FLAO|nr:Fic family protein [Flavobacterium cerinum]UUC45358.1 Fic family protein [Flavobacterium cerinum]